MSAATVVWVLTDGSPGHESQSQGVIDALRRPLRVEKIRLAVRSEFWRRLGRVLLQLHLPLPAWLLGASYEITLPAGPAPALIVASGGNTLLACALLARQRGAVSVYSGTLKNYPPHTVDLVISVTAQRAKRNLQLPIGPVPGEVSAVANTEPGEYLVMLIGGANREYPFSESDWRALVAGMCVLSQRSGKRWLVTTSRRSGEFVERLLAEELPAECVAERVLWGREPKRVVRDFLQRGAQIFVTEDSLTMVGEAIWSARPVVSIGLDHSSPSENDATALQGYVAAGLLQRVNCATLAAAQLRTGKQALPAVRERIEAAIENLLAAGGG